jgi:hypothetical protein
MKKATKKEKVEEGPQGTATSPVTMISYSIKMTIPLLCNA